MTETQSRLLDLGEALMRKRGFGGFSYADLAREIGIRKASIHHHFPTKSDLGMAVLDRYADQLADKLRKISSASRTGGQALDGTIKLYRDAIDHAGSMCLCSTLAADTEVIDRDMRERLAQANRDTAAWIQETLLTGRRDRSIAVGGDPALEAKAILAQLQGAQLLARAGGDPQIFDQAITTLVARLSRH